MRVKSLSTLLSTMNSQLIIEADLRSIIDELGKEIVKIEGKNILITGASGMLGGYITKTLMYANRNIFSKPCHIYLTLHNNSPFSESDYVHLIKESLITSTPSVKNINYIIHAASTAAPKLYINNMLETLNINILGLYSLLKMDLSSLESFLLFSSAEIYGNSMNEGKVTETYIGKVDHLNKRSCYVEGKRAAETISMNYYWEKNIPIKIARIFHTFGPGLNLDDGRVYSDFIKDGLEKKNISIRGNKDITRSYLYSKDASIMFFKLLLSNKNGEVYNIANEKNIATVEQLAKVTCDIFNSKYKNKLQVVIDNKEKRSFYKDAVNSVVPNMEKFKKDFHYVPSTDLFDAIKNTIDYYLSNNN